MKEAITSTPNFVRGEPSFDTWFGTSHPEPRKASEYFHEYGANFEVLKMIGSIYSLYRIIIYIDPPPRCVMVI